MFNPRFWGFRRPQRDRNRGFRGDPHLDFQRVWPNFFDEFDPRMSAGFHLHRDPAILDVPHRRGFPDPRSVDDFPWPPIQYEGQAVPRRNPRIPYHERRGSEHLPFRRAMRKLHRQLANAIRKYEEFQDAYKLDITPIKPYADDRVLEKLWVMKLKGKRDCGDPIEDPAMENADVPYDQFVATATHLTDCLRAARHSEVEGSPWVSPRQQRRMEAANRVLEKVQTASDHIVDLLQSASKGSEYCEKLVAELGALKRLIDPGENQDLYRENEDNGDLSDVEDDEQ